MAVITDPAGGSGATGEVHTSKQNDLGTVRRFSNGNSCIYLAGVGSTAVGSVVVFQPGIWTTALVATGLKGSLAVATAAVTASTNYGWYTYIGQDVGIARSAITSNTPLFAGGVAGSLDDTAVKGDQCMNIMARTAAAGGGDSVVLQFDRAFIGPSNESTG